MWFWMDEVTLHAYEGLVIRLDFSEEEDSAVSIPIMGKSAMVAATLAVYKAMLS